MAKEAAAKQGRAKDWAYIMGIYKKMSKAAKDEEEGEARPMPIQGISAREIAKSGKVKPISAAKLKALIKRYDAKHQKIPGGKAAKHKPGDFSFEQLAEGDAKYYTHLLEMEEKYEKAMAVSGAQPQAGGPAPPAGHSAHAAQLGEVHDWGRGPMRKVAMQGPSQWQPVTTGARVQPGVQQPVPASQQPQEGSAEHHHGQAMLHMQAAMAHATAHQSAVEQEEAASHKENVQEAKEVSQEAAEGREGRSAEPKSLEEQIQALMEQHGADAVAAAANKATKAIAGKLDKTLQAEAKKVVSSSAVKAAGADAIAAVGIRKGGEVPSKEKQAEAVKKAVQDPNIKKAARDGLKALEEPAAQAVAEGVEAAIPEEEKKKPGWKTKLLAAAKMMIRPFVFGFVDNFMMYVAGASVDGAVQGAGFSGAATAGIGNAISDAVGEVAGGAMERILPSEEKLKAQLGEKTYERMEKVLQPLGVFTGALLGMIPLLFGVKFGKSMEREMDIEKARKVAEGQLGFDFGEGDKPVEKPKKQQAGPYTGPRGGKYADPEHKIPWRESPEHHEEWAQKHRNAQAVHKQMKNQKGLPEDIREAHRAAHRAHLRAEAAHAVDATGATRTGGAPADVMTDTAREVSRVAMEAHVNVKEKRAKAAKPKPKSKGGVTRVELPPKPKPREEEGRRAAADRPPGVRVQAQASKKVTEPISRPGSGSHLQFSMEGNMDMAKDHTAAQINAMADKVMGGAKLDDVMDQLGNDDETKRKLLAELRTRKAKARKSRINRDELRKSFISVQDLRKGFYNRASEWADQFSGSPLYVEALQLLKDRIQCDKDTDAERSKHKSYRELEEMPRSKRMEARKKQEAAMDKFYKRQDAIQAKMSALEERLLDHKIEQAKAMGKGGGGAAAGPRDTRGLGPRDGRGGQCEGRGEVAKTMTAVEMGLEQLSGPEGYGKDPEEMAHEAAMAQPQKATAAGEFMARALDQALNDLIKAANGGSVSASMRPQNGKDAQTTLIKQGQEEENGPGSSEHHKDQAMVHLAAAQAHAKAHRSAKQLESADEHQQNVQAAQQASEAAVPPEEEAKKPMKKEPKMIRKGGMFIDISAEEEILAGLGEDGLSVQGAAYNPYAKHHMGALGRGDPNPAIREAHMVKGGVAGGTVYQGEHDVQGSRPGDDRESYMRARELAQVVHDDPAGHEGQGGLPDWWRDAGHLVAMPAGATPIVKAAEPPTQIIDDSDPMTRAMHNTDPREGQMGALMAYKGAGKGRGTL